jgi:hypothetical protein
LIDWEGVPPKIEERRVPRYDLQQRDATLSEPKQESTRSRRITDRVNVTIGTSYKNTADSSAYVLAIDMIRRCGVSAGVTRVACREAQE